MNEWFNTCARHSSCLRQMAHFNDIWNLPLHTIKQSRGYAGTHQSICVPSRLIFRCVLARLAFCSSLLSLALAIVETSIINFLVVVVDVVVVVVVVDVVIVIVIVVVVVTLQSLK